MLTWEAASGDADNTTMRLICGPLSKPDKDSTACRTARAEPSPVPRNTTRFAAAAEVP